MIFDLFYGKDKIERKSKRANPPYIGLILRFIALNLINNL